MPPKEQVIYWKMIWTNEPTKRDKVGCDGMYIKDIIPYTSLIYSNDMCDYCIKDSENCESLAADSGCFKGCKVYA